VGTGGRAWGGVTRRGAEAEAEATSASAEWRRAVDRARRETESPHRAGAPERWEPDVWVQEPERGPAVRTAEPTRRASAARRAGRPLPEDLARELVTAGGPRRGSRLQRELTRAAEAYEAGRYPDAQKILRPLADAAPTVAGVRELHGLTLYRLGRWRAAKAELEAYHALTDAVDQYPVVADCERALGRHWAVDERYEQLRRASPGTEVLTEGRLVLAGSLADRGRLPEAIAVLAPYERDRARPKEWHLRTWYALADLYERAGDVPRARALFGRLVDRDREFFDAAERLAGLR